MKRRKKPKKQVTLPHIPLRSLRPGAKRRLEGYAGDHGTGTAAAMAGMELQPVTLENGKPDPNNRARLRRVEKWRKLTTLSQRQMQAAEALANAWCTVEKLSSGGELQEQVDTSPRPDQAIAAQADAVTTYRRAWDAVPAYTRQTVEAVIVHNTDVKDIPRLREHVMADLYAALTSVADKLRY